MPPAKAVNWAHNFGAAQAKPRPTTPTDQVVKEPQISVGFPPAFINSTAINTIIAASGFVKINATAIWIHFPRISLNTCPPEGNMNPNGNAASSTSNAKARNAITMDSTVPNSHSKMCGRISSPILPIATAAVSSGCQTSWPSGFAT
jgi:hypothetical protein